MNRICILFLMIVVTASFAHVAEGQNNFTFTPTATTYFAEGGGAVLAADLIGTSRPDVVLLHASPNQVVIDDLDTAGTTTLNLPGVPKTIAPADLDGDGDRDFVVVSDALGVAGVPTAFVFLNQSGTFVRSDFASGGIGTIRPVDLDGDGDADLVIGRSLLINSGSGAFASGPLLTGAPSAVEFIPGDFDGDGDIDLAASYEGNTPTAFGWVCRIYRNDGGLSFTLLPTQLISELPPIALGASDAADMNGDGRADLVSASSNLPYLSSPPVRLTVHFGTANLVFGSPTIFEFGGFPQLGRLQVEDVTGDGHRDVILSASTEYESDGVPVVVKNDGVGNLLPLSGPLFYQTFGAATQLRSPFSVVDIDGDGDRDLVGSVINATNGKFVGSGVYQSSGPQSSSQGLTLTPTPHAYQNMLPSTSANIGASVTLTGAPTYAPAAGNFADVAITTPNAPFTIPYGRVWVKANAALKVQATSVVGSGDVLFSIPGNATTTSIHVTVSEMMSIVGGNNQSTQPNQLFGHPLAVQIYNAYPSTPIPLTYSVISGVPVTFLSPNPLTSEPSGFAAMRVRAGNTLGHSRVRAENTQYGINLEFDLDVGGAVFSKASGDLQRENYGGPGFEPCVVRLVDAFGAPIVGEEVVFSSVSPSSIVFSLSSTSTLTDAGGYASTTLLIGDNSGPVTVFAGSNSGGEEFSLFVRRLRVTSAPTVKSFNYRHENANLPMLLGIDMPLPAPGVVASPFGSLSTTIQTPGPNFHWLDGIGLFGPPDPTFRTNAIGILSRTYLGTFVYGITIVIQMYGYDVAYPYPECIIVSNPCLWSI